VKAPTVRPRVAGSAELADLPEPPGDEGAVLFAGLEVEICGTDAVPVADFRTALERGPADSKVVLDLGGDTA
jgi:hypothetical protein